MRSTLDLDPPPSRSLSPLARSGPPRRRAPPGPPAAAADPPHPRFPYSTAAADPPHPAHRLIKKISIKQLFKCYCLIKKILLLLFKQV